MLAAFTEVANLLGNKELIHLPTAGWVKFKFNQSNWKDLKMENQYLDFKQYIKINEKLYKI